MDKSQIRDKLYKLIKEEKRFDSDIVISNQDNHYDVFGKYFIPARFKNYFL